MVKQCYYDVLGVERTIPADELKREFRKLALRTHPDKAAPEERDAATARFQVIQEAYETLSDPQERAWYDAHREQILRGDEDGERSGSSVNIWPLFRRSAFSDFDDSPDGFYAVYRDAFARIAGEEADESEETIDFATFGEANSDWPTVRKFYAQWGDFVSNKSFASEDKYRPQDAENRQVRRAMEAENKKFRAAARKEYIALVRRLSEWCKKRDPRFARGQQVAAAAAQEAAKVKAAETAQAKAAKEAARKEARKAELERWAAAEAEAEESESEEEEKEEAMYCPACRKSFKTAKAFDSHAKSKKHLARVAELRAELLAEDEELAE